MAPTARRPLLACQNGSNPPDNTDGNRVMKLHKIKQNGNQYCGPSAISAIAGIGTREAAAIIRENSDKERIRFTHANEVGGALAKLGYGTVKVGPYERKQRYTLRQWAMDHARDDGVYLVASGKHWVLVQGQYAICGRTIDLVALEVHPNIWTFVTEAFQIRKLREVDPATVIPQNTASIASLRGKAYALARKYGITLEKVSEERDSSIGVWQKKGFHDPYDDGHYFGDWQDILDRVQEYVAIQVGPATGPTSASTLNTSPDKLTLGQKLFFDLARST
jgi:hypothetical protein